MGATSGSLPNIDARSYYIAAKRRIGVISPSLLAVQCLFFCGVYEMYTLRPINAWMSLHQASVQLQMHLSTKPDDQTGSSSIELERLEKRLYWSCRQSE
jgi:hypothetical protein